MKTITSTNRRRNEQLGMHYSTACGRLRKIILFQLVKECGRDNCYKCGEKIEEVGELTVEHKEPWLDVSAALFWDLNNIAFSHSRCNNTDRPMKPKLIHGTSSMYQNFGCRCRECKDWTKNRARKQRGLLV